MTGMFHGAGSFNGGCVRCNEYAENV